MGSASWRLAYDEVRFRHRHHLIHTHRQVRMRPISARLVVFSVALLGFAACAETPVQPLDGPTLRSSVEDAAEEEGQSITGWIEGFTTESTQEDSTEFVRDGGTLGGSGN
jgi:hypothetical protein